MRKNRISNLFQKLKQYKRSGLGIFITAGDPNIKISQWILNELPQNGRYLPLKINKEEIVVMMDSQTGDLYFPSDEGWNLDMSKK